MERATLEDYVKKLPVIEAAHPDVINRGMRQFADQDPSTQALDTWITTLRSEAGHLFQQASPRLRQCPRFLPGCLLPSACPWPDSSKATS